MKTKLLTLSVIATVFLASQASAISFKYSDYRDADLVGEQGKLLTNTVGIDGQDNSFATGEFDIVSDDGDIYTWDKFGFTPGKEVITAAEVAFGFYNLDTGNPAYLGDIFVNLGDSVPFSGVQGAPGSTLFEGQIVVPYGGELLGDILLDLQDDGRLTWRVELNDSYKGEILLYWAALDADAKSVPDSGSTAGLLGFSILAGLLVRRRFAS